ncbi:unnamed protein product [Periconia digitata]|uniref:GRF-like zinc ribbon domain-containing protein n=1 Tax=Periconia digitata TaxID=1303443 RepID=A0A9W4UH74_9PLEO|nr:unnamed protein product [Periconia digitata]
MVAEERESIVQKPCQRELSPSTMSTRNMPNFDLDLIPDEFLFYQDFPCWFGKSIFDSTVAEVVQKNHLGHPAINLTDTLELVTATYASAVASTGREATHASFYRYIYDIRDESDDSNWKNFLQTLSSHIATSCERPRKEKVSEPSTLPIAQPRKSKVPTSVIDDSSEKSPHSSQTLSIVPDHQLSTFLVTVNETSHIQQLLQPPTSYAPAPELNVAPNCIKCGRPTSLETTKESNRNGNARRPYYKCLSCKKFHCFVDLRGNDTTNPLCHCKVSSKRQLSGVGKHLQRTVHYVCRLGTCNYYHVEQDSNGHPLSVDDEIANQMVLLQLV